MERLTQWFGYGSCRVAGIASHLEEKHTAEELVDILAARLAAYEDTDLTPEDLRSTVDIDYVRIIELLKAEAEGRLAVLPCKMGDTVWMIVTKRPKISMPEFSFIKRSRLTWLNAERILRDFGKTVFLHREEAEAALRKEETP